MKRIALIICLCVLGVSGLFAQQEQQYTQFMFNKLVFNPAYSGSRGEPCLSGIYRKQWIGLEGAPESQLLSFHMPIADNRVGVGGSLYRYSIGITSATTLEGAYAYKVDAGTSTLSIGLSTSVRYYLMDFTDPRLVSTQPLSGDQSVPMARESKFLPNFGVGLYLNSDNFYIGLSAPRLIQNNIDFDDEGTVMSREARHIYLMSGVSIALSENVTLQPAALLKYVSNAPVDLDINVSAVYQEKYFMGTTYRSGGNGGSLAGESINIIFGIQATEDLLIGTSYDITMSDIREFDSGSMELILRYCFKNGNTGNSRFLLD